MQLDELRSELEEVRSTVIELAETETLDDEKRSTYDASNERFDALTAEIADREARAARVEELKAEAAKPEAKREGSFQIKKSAPGAYDIDMRGMVPTATLRDHAMRAVEGTKGELSEAQQAKVERLVRSDTPDGKIARHLLVTGRPEYREAFTKIISGNETSLTENERRAVAEVRAASLTDASGGYAVPFLLDPSVVLTNDGSANPVRQLARVVQITTDSWNGVSSAGVTASWDSEGTAVSDDAPTLAQPSVTAHKAQAFIPFSVEVGMDWASLYSEANMMFADAKDRLEAAAFITGSGSSQPYGIVTALDANTNVEVAVTTDNSFGVEDIYKVWKALPVRHRPTASWIGNIDTINRIRQFGTANNYHGYTASLGEGAPDQLMGRGLYESPDMDGAIGTGTDNTLVVGDFSAYLIADRIGMSVELVPHLFDVTNNRPTGQRGLLAWWRVGADSINDNAFRLLQV